MSSLLLRPVGLFCARLRAAPSTPSAVRNYAAYKPKDRQNFADALSKLSNKDMILVRVYDLSEVACAPTAARNCFISRGRVRQAARVVWP